MTGTSRREWTPRARRLYRAWTHVIPVIAVAAACYAVVINGDTADDAKGAADKATAAGLEAKAATNGNCTRIHRLVMTLDTILASGEAQTRKYVAEGLLTREQARRADRYREKQRAVLAGADCQPGS